MHVLIGMTRGDTISSGSFVHIKQVGQRIRSEGGEVSYVIGGKEDDPAVVALRDRGFKVFVLSKFKKEVSLFWDFLSLFELVFLIRKINPDVCSWHTSKIGALGRIVSALTKTPSVYVPHGVSFVDVPENGGAKVYRALEKGLSFLPIDIVGVCEFDRDAFKGIGVRGDKVRVIYNGMPEKSGCPSFPSGGDSVNAVGFITVARFADQKDYATLIGACALLKEEGFGFSLKVFGDGEKKDYVEGLIDEFHLNKEIELCGVEEDLSPFLEASDVFLLSSNWEGLPRSIIEAMSFGMPVVASDVGGVCELVESGLNGYLVEKGDVNGFCFSMKAYVENRELIRLHGQESYRIFKSGFTERAMLDSYCSLYKDIAVKK